MPLDTAVLEIFSRSEIIMKLHPLLQQLSIPPFVYFEVAS